MQKWKGGRNTLGKKILYTRGTRSVRTKNFNVNYFFRSTNLFFIAGFIFDMSSTKLLSVLILSSGSISYILTTTYHKIFILNKFLSFKTYKSLITLFSTYKISYYFGLLIFFKKFKLVSALELYPYKGIQYIRSSGTSGVFIKLDLLNKLSLIKLPSGVRKIFSIYSISSTGIISFKSKKYKINNRAGFLRRQGYSPMTRGVAMNPIDHPHGGRTKAIKYQRTP